MREEEIKNHPSQGLIQFSRVHGTREFFGSDSKPDSYVQLTIRGCEEKRDLVQSWYYERNIVTRLRLTNNQFAELITSLNMGSGVPCTLEFAKGEGKIEQENNREYRVDFHKRKTKDLFENSLKNIQTWAKDIEALKDKLSKKDQEILTSFTRSIIQELSSNFPFFIECYYEQMEKVAQEIKANVEADVLHKLTSLGLESINVQQLNANNKESE